jgi:hypothetical protein
MHTCHACGKKVYTILNGKTGETRPFLSPREGSFKMNLIEVCCEGADRIKFAEDRFNLR